MKQALLLCLLCLLFLNACENPMKLKLPEFAGVEGSVPFVSNLYTNGTDFSNGYASGLIRSDQIDLKWQKCNDANFMVYRLYRNDQYIASIMNANTCEYLDTGLQADLTYTYTLNTFIKNGMAETNQIQLKTPKFSAPNQFSFTYLPNPALKLSWHNNAESATSFIVEKTIQGSTPEVYTTTDSYFTDSQVQANGLYEYRVKALNSYEETDYSLFVQIYFQYTMNAPSLFSLTQIFPSYDVKLNWVDHSSGETAFHIYRSEGAGTNFVKIGQTGDNVTEFTDTSTKILGHNYSYFVRAYNSQESVDSNVMTIAISEQQYNFYDFEADNGGFVSNGSGWAHGTAYLTEAYSGNNLWGTTLGYYYYSDNANYTLTSPSINLPANSMLQFYHKYNIESYYDGGNVQISTDDGYSWTTINPEGDYPYGTVAALNGSGYSGENWGWHSADFDLAAYSGLTIKLRWVFKSDYTGNAYGWFIDNVKVGNVSSLKEISLEESWQK